MAEWTEVRDEALTTEAAEVNEVNSVVNPNENDGVEQEAKTLVILSKEELKELIREAAMTASAETVQRMEGVFADRTKAQKERRLHNTDLLLRNYRKLKVGCREAVWNREVAKQAFDEMDIIMLMKADDRVIVDSIKQSSEKTAVILAHIDRMIKVYREFCYKQGEREKRRYKAIKMVYLDEKQTAMKDIAARLNIALSQLYADLAIAKESLAALIFGVDGLHFGS